MCDSIGDSELGLSNYIVFRCDRNISTSTHSRGGGALIAIRNDIPSSLHSTALNNVEHLFVKITVNKTLFIIGSVYIPPRSPAAVYESFIELVQSILSSNNDCNLILCGDFNLPNITWSNDEFGLSYSSPLNHCLPESFAFLNLSQLNNVPNHLGKHLDLIFSNNNTFHITRSSSVAVPCDPYHPALEIISPIPDEVPSIDASHPYYNYRKANYPAIFHFLNSFNWTATLSSLDVDSATSALYDALHYCILHFVPTSKYVIPKFPPWFTPKLKSIVLAKRKAHALFKQSNDNHHYSQFSYLRAQYKYESKKCLNEYYARTGAGLKNNPNSFWKFVRNLRSENTIPNEVTFDDISCSGPQDISNLFSKYFNSVYSTSTSNSNAHLPHPCFDLPNNCSISLSDVESALVKLKTVPSSGSDGIPGTFLYNLRSFLCEPLWIIFNRSLTVGVFPSIWKLSSITPIYKSGAKSHARNYRPISILSHIAKIFEKLVLNNILPSVNPTLIDEQYGFRPGRSAVMNSLVFNNFILDAFDNHCQVDVIFTDFEKAFDRVDHNLLLLTLKKSGFGEPLLTWFASYLTGRYQWVKINEHKSEVTPVPSGVPQGGHLSPLLFALFLNGVKEIVPNCSLLAFADDLKIFRRISNESDCLLLQEELTTLVDWFESIGLYMNVTKCQSMSFTRSRTSINHTYSIKNIHLSSASLKKDLGIVFSSDLNFHCHIQTICCKAFKTLGFVKRISSEFKLTSPVKALYCSLVRPLLEYGSVLWDPHTASNSALIERVQRRFLSYAGYVLNIPHPLHDYTPVLRELGLSTLADRRVASNLKLLRGLINGSSDAPTLLSLINFRVPPRRTRSAVTFAIPMRVSNYSSNNPFHRSMRLANMLSSFLP